MAKKEPIDNLDNFDGVFEWFDSFVENLKTLPIHETHMLNFARLHDMQVSYEAIVNAIQNIGSNVKISCGYGDSGGRYGYIEAEGRSIDIDNIGNLLRAANQASNIEVYPLVSGNVRMTLTFHHLLVPI